MSRLVGIDPGANGALACWEGSTLLDVADMPATIERKRQRVDAAVLATLLRRYGPASIWIEQVHAMPRQGVASTFSFGVAYGIVWGVAGALAIPLTAVAPMVWKRALKVPSAKGEARARASQLIPSGAQWWQRVKDDGRAEAALIGLYGVKFATASPGTVAKVWRQAQHEW
jgi:crossover junction endodeoxyribonuclease RuvC